jgi:hypothetical protein
MNGAVLLDGYSIRANVDDLHDYITAIIKFWDAMPERAFSDVDTLFKAFEEKGL